MGLQTGANFKINVALEGIDDIGTRQLKKRQDSTRHGKPHCHKNFKASQMDVVSEDREQKSAVFFCQGCRKFPARGV